MKIQLEVRSVPRPSCSATPICNGSDEAYQTVAVSAADTALLMFRALGVLSTK
jgi:hypothetical protein